uniref:Putative secreted protein n=1 Tax=Anopheles darlingi TaxID=43151 RepID=A0A2M4D4U6_ANODA
MLRLMPVSSSSVSLVTCSARVIAFTNSSAGPSAPRAYPSCIFCTIAYAAHANRFNPLAGVTPSAMACRKETRKFSKFSRHRRASGSCSDRLQFISSASSSSSCSSSTCVPGCSADPLVASFGRLALTPP